MLCCAGLIGGMAVGQYLGGPWTFVAPAAGFGVGLVADMKFMKHHHGAHRHPVDVATKEPEPVRDMEPAGDRIPHQAEPTVKT